MAEAAWATAAAVTTRLGVLGVTLPSGVTAQQCVDEAIADWNRETGYNPFLATGVNVTRKYNPSFDPYRLYLIGGAVGVTSVTVDKVTGSSGTLLTVSEDYFLERMRVDGPYEYIVFTSPQFGQPQSIEIVSNEGFGSTIPTPAWRAVFDRSVDHAIREIEQVYGPVRREKQGPVEYEYHLDSADKKEERFLARAAKYTKLPI